MKQKTVAFLLAGCFCLSTLTVYTLYAMSDRTNHRNNSFVRLFPPGVITKSVVFDIKYNSYYIAGTTDENIYLGNLTAPTHLLTINRMLTDTQHVNLKVNFNGRVRLKTLQLKINDPFFYLTDGTTIPGLFRGRIGDWVASRFMFDSVYFNECAVLGHSSLALRSLRSSTGEYELGKLLNDPTHFQFKPNLLEKQVDGKFCVDGMLHYNEELNRLVYLYYYRNQYIVMDTLLNLEYRGNTIDTIRTAKFKVGRIESENAVTMTTRPYMVNKMSTVYGNWLFVNSNSMAKNESETKYNRSSVIDVYDLRTGEYLLSFYLLDYKDTKVRNFRIIEDAIIVLHDHYIIKYDLTNKFFDVVDKLVKPI